MSIFNYLSASSEPRRECKIRQKKEICKFTQKTSHLLHFIKKKSKRKAGSNDQLSFIFYNIWLQMCKKKILNNAKKKIRYKTSSSLICVQVHKTSLCTSLKFNICWLDWCIFAPSIAQSAGCHILFAYVYNYFAKVALTLSVYHLHGHCF